jgi:hypothetical protein
MKEGLDPNLLTHMAVISVSSAIIGLDLLPE